MDNMKPALTWVDRWKFGYWAIMCEDCKKVEDLGRGFWWNANRRAEKRGWDIITMDDNQKDLHLCNTCGDNRLWEIIDGLGKEGVFDD